ncbi:MbnP family protein [Fluviicola taffensis]|uniref:Uncharacterized protein n=1 Tax=Fluviicola taffensis (strain DSM 16823 / NCIMB 13979 / RW262) TaxID=755732 RepID=F2IIP5_FLUTR|nr:MbnP family protein [Fluviicola taffensis]AEA46007.1 hypothetical protein Fluta_4045 [Fluviicola taffensis DSM 16823]
MKNIFLALALLSNALAFSQSNVSIVFHHKLGNDDFAFNTVHTNNLGNSFKLIRLEYYITKYSIVHDGGQITQVSSDTVSLIRAQDLISTIQLGQFNITNIEGVKFYIGVHTPVNHEDPSLFPSYHPLAFQAPSMHWGWTSGYRFIALEGQSGPTVNQTLEIHSLDDHNYFQTSVNVNGEQGQNGLEMHVDADYVLGLYNININSGLVVHGADNEAANLVSNFVNYVFTPNVLAVKENQSTYFSIFPNPANGTVQIQLMEDISNCEVELLDVSGKLISTRKISSDAALLSVQLENPGFYMLNLMKDGKVLQSSKLINN